MKKLGLLICASLTLFYGLSAEEEKCEQASTFISAGERADPETEQQEEKEPNQDEQPSEELLPMAVYHTSHPGALHTTFKNWNYGEKIELNDGSIWAVSLFDQWKVNAWLASDIILVKLNHSFLSSHRYELVNQSTGDYVDVDLVELEVLPYDASFYGQRAWVVAIDYLANIVTLQDGSVWTVSFSDDSILRTWRVGDVVILGVNDCWDSTLRPNLLINFNTLSHIKANCVN